MKLYIVSSPGHVPSTGVRTSRRHILVNVPDTLGDEREYVKREASRYLFGDPDHYVVEPLTRHGEVVFLSLSLSTP